MDHNDYVRRYLDKGEAAVCRICGRICRTIIVDPKEYQQPLPPKETASAKQEEQPRFQNRRIPREADNAQKEYVYVSKTDGKNILCKMCFSLQRGAEEGFTKKK
jgi:hypothetical protein